LILDLIAIAWLGRGRGVRPGEVVDVAKRGARFIKACAVPLPKTPAEALQRIEAAAKKELGDE
jgi:hypothetical protein